MDPNETLRQIAAADLRSEERELSLALNDWLAKGGFKPDWDKYPMGTQAYKEHMEAMGKRLYIDQPSPENTKQLSAKQIPQGSYANSVQVDGDHYKKQAIQPWDYIVANDIGYLEGNVIKYVSRWRDKGGLKDLEKAAHYITKLIEVERAKQ